MGENGININLPFLANSAAVIIPRRNAASSLAKAAAPDDDAGLMRVVVDAVAGENF